jgi:hypothetical protein
MPHLPSKPTVVRNKDFEKSESSNSRNANFLLSGSTQPSAFFLDTRYTMDSIDAEFAQPNSLSFSEDSQSLTSHAFDPPTQAELESGRRIRNAKRATWWPMPGASISNENGEQIEAVYQ